VVVERAAIRDVAYMIWIRYFYRNHEISRVSNLNNLIKSVPKIKNLLPSSIKPFLLFFFNYFIPNMAL
jgi:hypothetical protein